MTSPGASRRRAAPIARESSDITRFRAFGGAALVFVATVVSLLALRIGPATLVSPGPLARPHRALPCGACHATSGENDVSGACVGCHGAHPSARPGHAALVQTSELGCGACHAVHRSESGIAFEQGGAVVHYGTGFERPLGRSVRAGAPPIVRTALVPLVTASACVACHDLERDDDPASACFAGSKRSGGAYSLCFDEHRRPGERSGARRAERDAAVARARELVPRLDSSPDADWVPVGSMFAIAAAAAGLVVVVGRKRARRVGGAARPATGAPSNSARRLPVIDAARCLGCQACVDACPYDVLEMSRYVASVARPDACCGAGPCLVACPNGSLVLADGAAAPSGPRLTAELEVLDRPGVHLAGDVTGGALIRSALEQGTRAARTIAQALGSRKLGFAGRRKSDGSEAAPFDVIVVGAGPAGLATGLEALRHGLDVLVLEQAGIAESIRRFSRDKLVLAAGANGEMEVPLWVGDARKEELVRRWLREVHARRLPVRERTRVTEVQAYGSESFRVRAVTAGQGELAFFSRRVVLATGSRGSPRRLAASVSDDAMCRVHYDLSDARAFAGRNVVVVGLGDVAMETALALALQPGTTVTLVHRGAGFSRGRRKNVEAIGRLVAAGRISILFGAVVRTIHTERLVVELAGGTRSVPYDALFVHIGSEAPAQIPLTQERKAESSNALARR